MKKTILLIVTFISFYSNAQYFEGFENGFPGSMTETLITGSTSWTSCGGDTGGAICPITGTASATFYLGNSNVAITALNTPVLDLSSGNYRLTFNRIQRVRATKKNYLNVELSQDAGATWVNMGNFFTEAINSKKESINLPAITSSTCKIRFRAANKFGYSIILDDIELKSIPLNDAAMTSLNVNAVLLAGDTTITGIIKNTGMNVITTAAINWQIDGGTIYSNTLNGLNIGANQNYTFTATNLWAANAGPHVLSVWVNNTNGLDLDNSNNQLSTTVNVASAAVTRFPLFQKFTSSTCPPCASFDTGFGPFYGLNIENLALINYQVNWPSTGDPYFTSEVNTRRIFYGVTGAPTMYVDSDEKTDSSSLSLNNNLNISQTSQAFFGLSATADLVNNNINVVVNTMPYLTGNYNLMVAVVEKITTGNATTNGETEFKNVMMKMMPNASGTVLNCVHDTPITTNLSANVANGTYINTALTGTALTANSNKIHTEDITNLEVIVFVQDMTTKAIMQAAKATTLLSSNAFELANQVKLYPNPTSGILKVTAENNFQMQIIDVLGKVVYSSENVANGVNIDLSNLQKGVYIAKIVENEKISTQKIILK